MKKPTEEICPVCAEKGIAEPRKVRIERTKDKIVKHFSPCGHKHVIVSMEDKISLADEVKVNKEVTVTDEISLTDSVSVIRNKVLEGYSNLSATFDVRQRQISQELNIEGSIRELVQLNQEMLKGQEEENRILREQLKGANREKWIGWILALTSIFVAIIVWFYPR